MSTKFKIKTSKFKKETKMKKLLLAMAFVLSASNAMAADRNFRSKNNFISFTITGKYAGKVVVNTDHITHIHDSGAVFLVNGVSFPIADKTLEQIRALIYTEQAL